MNIMRFSQRIGKTPVKTILQVDDIDRDLKNALWNALLEKFFYELQKCDYSSFGENSVTVIVHERIWKDFFKRTIDTQPHNGYATFIREWFFNEAEWHGIYDFVEFVVQMLNNESRGQLKITLNKALEEEMSGYRIVGENIAKVTDDEEIKAIEEALVNTDKWKPVTTHLKTALEFFTDRKNPNYRNSVKESISSVESSCRIILNNDKATLGDALSVLEKNHGLPHVLKRAFSTLYGYTSDEGGIRHALTESDVLPDFDDAKFMLVSCSAFTNYLKTKIKPKK